MRDSDLEWRAVEAQAEKLTHGHRYGLSDLRLCILRTLWEAGVPLGAYEITQRLNIGRTRHIAPNSVYRALDFLSRVGLVHKVESRQSFVLLAPDTPDCRVLLVCDDCRSCRVLDGTALHRSLAALADEEAFAPDKQVVEVPGRCSGCRERALADA